MLNKKLMILIIIFVSLLTVSAVSAADNVTDDVVSVEETTTGALGVGEAKEVVSVEDNQVILENTSNVGTFDELSSLIENTTEETTLELNKDYKYVSGSTGGIQINKAITIDGKGQVLDGNKLSRIFHVKAKGVVLKNINFVNCSSSSGGAVYVNCSSSSYYGGAVYWYGSEGILANCSFVNCSSSYRGGAVYWDGSNGSLVGCSFVNCYASSSYSSSSSSYHSSHVNGGAVYWGGSNGVLSNCSFVRCYVSSSLYPSYPDGSAVYWGGSNGSLVGCSFVNCSTKSFGGAVYWNSRNGSLVGCSFCELFFFFLLWWCCLLVWF